MDDERGRDLEVVERRKDYINKTGLKKKRENVLIGIIYLIYKVRT